MAGERMLSTGQTAKRLGISVRTIYRWEAAGRLVPISRLPSGQRRFSSRDIDALLQSRVRGKERCAVYARVSSEKQAEAGNLGRKKDRLVAAATAKGYEVATTVAERASDPLRFRLQRGGFCGLRGPGRGPGRAGGGGCGPRSWWPICWPS